MNPKRKDSESLKENNRNNTYERIINEDEGHSDYSYLEEIINSILKSPRNDIDSKISDSAHIFLVFLCGDINSDAFTSMVKSRVVSQGYKINSKAFENPRKDITENKFVASTAFQHAIEIKSFVCLKYIMTASQAIGCSLKFTDLVIEDILINFETHQACEILQLLVSFKYMLDNEDGQSIKLTRGVSEIKRTSSPIKHKINKNHKDTNEEVKQIGRDSDLDEHIKDENITKPPSEEEHEFFDSYSEILPIRFTPIKDEIRIDNIIEIALRSDRYNKSQLFELIKSMSESTCKITKTISLDEMMMLRVLVVYSTFDVFNKTLNYFSKAKSIKEKSEYVPLDITEIKINNEFETLEDTICEIVSFSLEIDNVPFLIKLYDEFKQEIELAYLKVPDMIISSIVKQYQKNLQVTYFVDKIRIIELICEQCGIGAAAAVQFSELLHNLINQPPTLNVFANSYNPIKLATTLIKFLRTLDKSVLSMKDELMVLEERIVDLTVSIIEDLESKSILRNWMFDDFDDELKVIDYLAQLDLIKILNMPKVSKVVELIWRGNYDCRKGGSLVNEIKTSAVGEAFRTFDVDFDTFITVISFKHCGACIYYSLKICYTLLIWGYQLLFKRNKSEDIIFGKGSKVKAGTFGFSTYINSIRLQFLMETIGILITTVIYITYFVLWIAKSIDMRSTYAMITASSSPTDINNYYAKLYSQGQDWFTYFRACVIISAFMISFLIQDIMILLSYFVRRISIKSLSPNFMLLFLLDLVCAGFAIYLVIKFIFYYNVDRTLTRFEEKYYTMYKEIITNKLEPMHCFCYIVCVLFFRVLYQQIYFGELGALVQIILKMAIKIISFLIVYFTIMLAFSLIGYGLFNDVASYSSLSDSFKTMFQSSLGGFDYTLFDNAAYTSSTAGRIYLSIYLLVSAILLLNFLIAILNDTYTEFINNGRALQSKEIIKLRAIYEHHEHYQCLVKAPNLINFYMIFLAPFVILLKSRRLNRIVLHIEYSTVSFFVQIGLILNLTITTPVFIIISIFIKLRNAFSAKYSKGALDTILRLVDIFVMFWLFPFICGIIYFGVFFGQIGFSYNDNLIKMVEINRKEYETINKIMDASIKNKEELDSIQAQQKYFLFKSFISRKNKLATVFDPSDSMLSDSIIYVMVATMKQIKVRIQKTIGTGAIDDSIPIYVPTVMVVEELASNLYLDEHFKTIVFGMHYKNKHNFDRTKLKLLAKTIANRTLWDISQDEVFNKEYDKNHPGTNIMTALTVSNYEAKYDTWLNKLEKLIFESNEHWLINQFQYCKIFLFKNSFELDLSEIPEYLFKVVPNLNELKSKDSAQAKTDTSKLQDKKNDGNEWNSKIKNTTEDEPDSSENSKIKMLNIPSLIGFFLANESKLKQIHKTVVSLGIKNKKVLRQFEKLMIRRENQAISRLTSSSFSSTYAAIKKFIKS